MSSMSLELSDGLVELSGLLKDYEHEPKVLDPEDARTLRAILRQLRLQARSLENEVSRHRWNAAARAERAAERDADRAALRDAGDALLAEISRPGSNIALFPVIHRPFTDGRSGRPA